MLRELFEGKERKIIWSVLLVYVVQFRVEFSSAISQNYLAVLSPISLKWSSVLVFRRIEGIDQLNAFNFVGESFPLFVFFGTSI